MKDFKDIYVDRNGESEESNMTTLNVINNIIPNKNYIITKNNLLETNKSITKETCNIEIPKYIEIEGIWNKNNKNIEGNILGGYGEFIINLEQLIIPTNISTKENLAFYNCKLFNINDVITFDTNDILPVTTMKIGKNYIKDYIMKKTGVYLEYHDRPHFHMPINKDSKGYLILGKKINNKYYLSAFKIPYGKAVYISPYTIHNDCFLIGKYIVVYSKTNIYSTVILKNKEFIKINFC